MKLKRSYLWMTLILIACVLAGIPGQSQTASAQVDYPFTNYLPLVMTDPRAVNFTTVGPDGGTVVSLMIDPSDPATVLAGTWGDGVYKTSDGGKNWHRESDGMQAGFVFDVTIDPDRRPHYLASAYEHGVYESKDGGKSWYQTRGMKDGTVVYSIKFRPGNSNIVYAAVRFPTIYTSPPQYPGGVYKSIDGGSTWNLTSSGLPNDYVYDVAIDPRYPNVMYTAMHQTGVYKSTDGGASWFSVNNNIHYRDARGIDINPVNSHVYVGMYDGKGVAYSSNGGSSWTPISGAMGLSVFNIALDPVDQRSLYLTGKEGLHRCYGSPYPTGSASCALTAQGGRYVYDVSLDAASAAATGQIKKLYIGGVNFGVQKSTDGGTTFAAINTGLKCNEIVSILNDPLDPSVLYVSSFGRGVYKSLDDGATWARLDNGLSNKNITTLAFRPGDLNVIYAGTLDAGLYLSLNSGASWSAMNSGLSRSVVIPDGGDPLTADAPPHLYDWMDPLDVAYLGLDVIERNAFSTDAVYPEILAVGINPLDPSRMVLGTRGAGILKSNDFGQTWTTTPPQSGEAYDFMVDPSQPEYFYFAGVLDQAVLTSDSARNLWSTRNNGFHAGADVFGLSLAQPSMYFAASDYGVYKTNAAGKPWYRLGFSSLPFNDVLADAGNPGFVYAASTYGVFRSDNYGKDWIKLGRENLNDRFLTIAQGFGQSPVYFGLSGGNVYKIGP